jgi:hypothetical protein
MRTKKLALAVFVMFGLALVALPAHAQSNIVLGTSTQGITFTGTGSSDSVGLDLGACGATTCTMSGVAFGTGLLTSKGAYTITSPSDLTLSLTDASTGLWTAITQGNSVTFNYGQGGGLLTGVLNLLQFQQISNKVSGSKTWYLTSADLTVDGGSAAISKGMEMTLNFDNVPVNFNSLLGSNNVGSSESTAFGHGVLAPTPEPASMLMLGAGFLLIGYILRVRFRRGDLIVG